MVRTTYGRVPYAAQWPASSSNGNKKLELGWALVSCSIVFISSLCGQADDGKKDK